MSRPTALVVLLAATAAATAGASPAASVGAVRAADSTARVDRPRADRARPGQPPVGRAARPAGARAAAPVRPVWPDEGPMTWAPRPTVAAITANDLRTRLYAFAHDSMAGRRIGEPGNAKGTAWIAAEFRRLGLRPAGENGTYFQELPFGQVGFDTTALRLAAGDAALAARTEWVPLAPSALFGLAGTAALDGVPTVFAGRYGDTTALDPARLRGKVAVFVGVAGAPGTEPPARPAAALPRCDSVPDMFGAAAAARVEAERAAGRLPAARPQGPALVRDVRAQAAGAAGVLIVAPNGIAPSVAAQAFASRMSMQPPAAPAAAPNAAAPNPAAPLPGAAIAPAAAARLFAAPLEGLAVGTEGAPVRAAWRWTWTKAAAPSRNVIAVLPGADPARAGEYVLVGAHNDHVGTLPAGIDHDSVRAVNLVTRRQGANDPVCRPTAEQQRRIDSLIARARSIRPVRRDSIMNGADDDGSGTVVMLEIAERFARATGADRPARSMVFISHQGEEAGLLGSRWFVDHPTIPLDKVVAAHNMDMVGRGRASEVKFGGPNSLQILGARRLSREFGDVIDSVNAVRAEPMALDKSWEVRANPLNRFCRSDQVSYVLKNVPVTYFSLGYAQDYHQATDEPQYVDYEHSARVARFIGDVMLAIAQRPTRLAIAGPDPDFPTCR